VAGTRENFKAKKGHNKRGFYENSMPGAWETQQERGKAASNRRKGGDGKRNRKGEFGKRLVFLRFGTCNPVIRKGKPVSSKQPRKKKGRENEKP